MLNIARLSLWRKGLKVERLHTVTHIVPYNNGFHSCNAALIAHDLCVLNNIDSAAVIRYMLLHDVAEGYVGDTPANVKKDFPQVKLALNIAEGYWEEEHIPDMPDLHPIEQIIAKISDSAELGMYCLEEINLGNTGMNFVLNNIIKYFREYDPAIKGVTEFHNYFISRGK